MNDAAAWRQQEAGDGRMVPAASAAAGGGPICAFRALTGTSRGKGDPAHLRKTVNLLQCLTNTR